MSTPARTPTTPALASVLALASELETVRAERDDCRKRWLRQVDINDAIKARIAEDACRVGLLEAIGRE